MTLLTGIRDLASCYCKVSSSELYYSTRLIFRLLGIPHDPMAIRFMIMNPAIYGASYNKDTRGGARDAARGVNLEFASACLRSIRPSARPLSSFFSIFDGWVHRHG